ncbi:hypothetical protein [Metabacillus niabensis]|uniref:Nucleosome binding factor SPN SPT16 subunit n=1 Tax=Metabacillus niabensis TaxID=324854 RepID=A0ABT9YZT1_9BACI|nr:hypothetical protein [Metabacillus niabensis]MDQ0224823.1 nucleosome binding factor SPN SPT16 subunit [Metabacillus niabensis]
MDLFEIFTNPLVWAIIVGLITKLFFSKDEDSNKKKEQTNNKPKQKLPKPVMTTVERHKEKREKHKTRQTVQQAYEKMQKAEVGNYQKNIDAKQKIRGKSYKQVKQNPSPVRDNRLIVDRRNAIQGVIWSEILGPPRSKNPHYTRNKRHS